MKPEVMHDRLKQFREVMAAHLARLHELTVQVGDQDLRQVSERLLAGLNSPFLFVVVGEVKAGKSSFINALLHSDITRVAPDPCTDTIQRIVYAPEPFERRISERVLDIGRPIDILREVAIVDTPGTNSIIDQHQEITERFIPESDLVIFVFPAQNPYSKTAWDFFQFVHHQWHKKIIFVLQQADRATPEEIQVNRARVAELARARHVENPRIFVTSARMAWEDETRSGMAELWGFIRDTVTGGRHYAMKMESILGSATNVLGRVGSMLTAERRAIEADRAEALRVETRLRQGHESGLRDVEVLRNRLAAVYLKLSQEAAAEFEAGLSLASLVKTSIQGALTRKNRFKAWAEDITRTFNERLSERVESVSREAAGLIAENVLGVMESLVDEMRLSQAQLPRDLGSPAMTRQRFLVVDEVTANVTRLIAGDRLAERLRPPGLSRIGDQAVMGGVITAIGAVIAATAHAVVFDITGGLVTTVGAALAINTLAFKRRTTIRRFKEGLEEGRERFEEELSERLSAQIGAVFDELSRAFSPFFEAIAVREAKLAELEDKAMSLSRALADELHRVEELETSEEDA